MTAPIELAYVGSVVPDTPDYHNAAFSRAGNMFQENLLAGLREAGIAPSLVVSARPLPAFPRSRRLWQPSSRTVLPCGIAICLPGFVNVSPLKQLALGLGVFLRLLWWGWRRRTGAARVVYTFNLTVPPALFTLAAARLIGARAVASVNDINEPGATVPRTWKWRLDFALHRWLLPRFDALVAVSRAIVEDFAPGARHVVVEGGVTEEMGRGLGAGGWGPGVGGRRPGAGGQGSGAGGRGPGFCLVLAGGWRRRMGCWLCWRRSVC